MKVFTPFTSSPLPRFAGNRAVHWVEEPRTSTLPVSELESQVRGKLVPALAYRMHRPTEEVQREVLDVDAPDGRVLFLRTADPITKARMTEQLETLAETRELNGLYIRPEQYYVHIPNKRTRVPLTYPLYVLPMDYQGNERGLETDREDPKKFPDLWRNHRATMHTDFMIKVGKLIDDAARVFKIKIEEGIHVRAGIQTIPALPGGQQYLLTWTVSPNKLSQLDKLKSIVKAMTYGDTPAVTAKPEAVVYAVPLAKDLPDKVALPVLITA